MTYAPNVPVHNSPIIAVNAELNARNNAVTGRDVHANGVFGSYPGATPKYARHLLNRKNDNMDTMARMFIQIPPQEYDRFIKSLGDTEMQRIAKVLTGDNVNKGGKGYFDFLLQNVVHSLSERMQVVETLADNYVSFFFGASPPVWQYSGTLYNTYQDDWTMRMFRIYNQLARGTALARRKYLLQIKYDSLLVTGAMTNFSFTLTSGREMATSFNFTLLVKSAVVLYGGLNPPTTLPKDTHFLPQDAMAEVGVSSATSVVACNNVPAGVQQTLVGTNTTYPWEVSEKPQEYPWEQKKDPTGTPIQTGAQEPEPMTLTSNVKSSGPALVFSP